MKKKQMEYFWKRCCWMKSDTCVQMIEDGLVDEEKTNGVLLETVLLDEK